MILISDGKPTDWLTDWNLYESLTKEIQVFESFELLSQIKQKPPKLHPLSDK